MVSHRATLIVDYAELRTAVRAVDAEAQSLDVPTTVGPPGLLGVPPRESED